MIHSIRKLFFREALVALILAATLAGCRIGGFGNGEKKQNGEDEEETVKPVPVEITTLSRGSISSYIVSSSTIRPVSQVTVFAKTRGLVTSVMVNEGDTVKKGDILAEIEDSELKLQYERAVEVAERKKVHLDRTEELYSKKLVSDSEWERISFEAAISRTDEELARLAWEGTKVTAPVNGIVTERTIEPGRRLDPAMPVFKIENTKVLYVDLDLPERDLAILELGVEALISPGYDKELVSEGYVEFIAPSINPASGTGRVRIRINDKNRGLRSGSFVRVKIVTNTEEDALLVPKKALVRRGDETTVFVVADSIAVRKIIEGGLEDGFRLQAKSGVDEGDMVVVVGQQGLKDSSLVLLPDETP